MARIKVRYLVKLPGAAGELPRWFWQPSSAMRALGWRPQRVPLNWSSFADAGQLEAAAIGRAMELNAEMDAQRIGQALAAARPAPAPTRTLGELMRQYRTTRHWLEELRPRTRKSYLQCLKIIEAWAADAPVRAIDAKRVQVFKESMSATPAYANAVIRVLRLVLEYGRRESWIQINPAQAPALNGSTPSGIIWPRAAVEAFVATADAMDRRSIGTAVLLNEWLGQREEDILRMPRTVLRGGNLLARQGKTGAGVILPVDLVPHLAERLRTELERLDKLTPTPMHIIVNEQTGVAYKPDNFHHVFAQVRAKAAEKTPLFEIDTLLPGRDSADPEAFQVRMLDLTFQRLRHTAVTRLGEAGCDPGLISSVTGHSQVTVVQLMARYMVRTGEMARAAFQKRLDAEKKA